MSPEVLSKAGTEHAHQVALFAWCAVAAYLGFDAADDMAAYGNADKMAAYRASAQPVYGLNWYHAIPNGGARGDDKASAMIRGGQLKAEGVKSGVSDTLLPVFRRNLDGSTWHGLYIELKKPVGSSGESDKQIEFGKFVTENNFCYRCCYGWREAADVIKDYYAGRIAHANA